MKSKAYRIKGRNCRPNGEKHPDKARKQFGNGFSMRVCLQGFADNSSRFFRTSQLVCLVLGYVLALVTLSTLGTEYTVQGIVQKIKVDDSGQVTSEVEVSVPFRVSVRGQQWNLWVEEPGGEYYNEYGCDGTNVYTVFNWTANRPPKAGTPACVEKGSFPYNAASALVKLPWLAYASASYLDHCTNSFMPAPWGQTRVDPVCHIFTYAAQRSHVEPFLPTQVVFTVSAKLKANVRNVEYMDKGTANLEVRRRLAEYLKYYEPGFVGGEYSVTEWTNLGGLLLPKIAWFNRYSGMLRADGGKPLLIEQYRIFATDVSVTAPASFLPALEWPLSMVDRRVKDREVEIDYVLYTWTNNSWPVTIPPIAQSQLAWLKANRLPGQPEPRTSSRKVPVVAMVLVCTAVLPLVFLCARHFLRKCKFNSSFGHRGPRITPGGDDS